MHFDFLVKYIFKVYAIRFSVFLCISVHPHVEGSKLKQISVYNSLEINSYKQAFVGTLFIEYLNTALAIIVFIGID